MKSLVVFGRQKSGGRGLAAEVVQERGRLGRQDTEELSCLRGQVEAVVVIRRERKSPHIIFAFTFSYQLKLKPLYAYQHVAITKCVK